MMVCLSTTRALVLASLPDKSEVEAGAGAGQTKTPRPSFPTRKNTGKKKQRLKKGQGQGPSLIQVERAIGAGRYRDIDTREEDKKKTEFDGLLPITTGQFETPVEETLRKAGRWLVDNTAKDSGSAVIHNVPWGTHSLSAR